MSKKKHSLAEKVLEILRAEPNKSMNYKQISAKLSFDTPEIRKRVQKDLKKLK